ncbi:MAG: RNA methyltransferase [Lachnospiraceae bacterium]|nr:RNA methyltransferase [Lachnospiraceae bacterium]
MITAVSNPRVKQVVLWQTKAKERKEAGVFLVEGFKMFEEAPMEWIREVYISTDALAKVTENREYISIKKKLDQVVFEEVSAEVFRKMSDTQTPQGILCVVKRPSYGIEDLLASENPMLVVLENLQDPGNVGTIVRTGEGAGVTGVILSEGSVDIYNPKTIRATMGSIYRVPVVYAGNLVEVTELLRKRNIKSYAAHLAGEKYYNECDLRTGCAFLIGNEGNGLTEELAAAADEYLKIPMEGQVESLNAAIATSLLMYEAHRQRG